MTWKPLSLVVVEGHVLYALRSDGQVFTLMRRGDILPNGRAVDDPYWAKCPAIPGTEGAVQQEG